MTFEECILRGLPFCRVTVCTENAGAHPYVLPITDLNLLQQLGAAPWLQRGLEKGWDVHTIRAWYVPENRHPAELLWLWHRFGGFVRSARMLSVPYRRAA